MNETTVTVVGNLVEDPTLRTTDSGRHVAGFRVASTARRWDAGSGQHVDGDSLFLAVSCWRSLATNVVASLHRGDPVILTGRLYTRTYEVDGRSRSVCELAATAVGPDLSRAPVKVLRAKGRAPEEVASGGSAGQDAAPDGVAQDGVAPDGVAREGVAPDAVAAEPELVGATG